MSGGVTGTHNYTTGEVGLTADSNAQDLMLLAHGKSLQAIFNVRNYGADATGATFSDAAVTAATAAMVAAGAGVLYFPTGTYKVTALPSFVPVATTGVISMTYAVRGDGSALTIINHYGTSPAASLTVSNPLFNVGNASIGAPVWSGFTLDGANSSGGCSGIVWGDVSYGTFHDVAIQNFATGDGFCFPNGYGWTEGIGIVACKVSHNLNQIRFDVGSGLQAGVITTAAASGATVTSLAVAGGTSMSFYSGQNIVLAAATSVPGVAVVQVTTTAAVAQGATSIPITSIVLPFALVAGTSKVYKGGWASFDYWTVNQLYMTAGTNQNGVVVEASRGLKNGVIERLGTTWRMSGNFSNSSATNTGIAFWIKGNDRWEDVNWDVTCEFDGSGLAHKSIQLDATTSYFGGFGHFVLYYFGAYTGQGYQMGLSNKVTVAGYSDPVGSVFSTIMTPFARSVKASVTPSGASPFTPYATTARTTGISWQNNAGKDVFVTIPITATAAGASAGWNVDTFNTLTAGATIYAGLPSGMTVPLTFIHYAGSWARIDFTNATCGAPVTRYV